MSGSIVTTRVAAGIGAEAARQLLADRRRVLIGARNVAATQALPLADILFARALATHAAGTATIAFDPVYLPCSGLAREAPGVPVKLFEWVATWIMPKDRVSTVAWSREAVARLATDSPFAGEHGAYWSMRGEPVRATSSKRGRDDTAAGADGAAIMGLPA